MNGRLQTLIDLSLEKSFSIYLLGKRVSPRAHLSAVKKRIFSATFHSSSGYFIQQYVMFHCIVTNVRVQKFSTGCRHTQYGVHVEKQNYFSARSQQTAAQAHVKVKLNQSVYKGVRTVKIIVSFG